MINLSTSFSFILLSLLVGACSTEQPGSDDPPLALDSGAPAQDAGSQEVDAGPGESCDDPGFVPLRRLTRRAFGHALRDLLGVDAALAEPMPEDDIGHGYDHLGEVLSFTAVHFAQAEQIIESALEQALRRAPDVALSNLPAEDLGGEVGGPNRNGGWNLWSNGELVTSWNAAVGGTYILRAYAYGQQAGDEPARMTFRLDNVDGQTFDVANSNTPARFQTRVAVEPGVHSFAVAFINDYYAPNDPDPNQRDRNLIVDRLEIEGPFDISINNELRDALIPCDLVAGADCALPSLRNFAAKAWRTELADADFSPLQRLLEHTVAAGASWEDALRLAMKTVLLSPRLTYLIETPSEQVHRLSGYELATRLAFFLWDAPPDADLLSAAGRGELDSPEPYLRIVEAALASPKTQQILTSFFAQWLQLSNLDSLQPDYHFFPDFDEPLRRAMRLETDLLLAWAFNGDHSLAQLIDGAPSFVNDRLAAHYDVPPQGTAVPGHEGWFEVDARAAHRGGLLSNASVLTLTSFPTRTSPVKRGKWVLERLLCDAPPPPPPGVEGNFEDVNQGASLRERLAQHRADPSCTGCHLSMDPIGLGMEGFDGIGRRIDPRPDVTGELPDGRSFNGVLELQTIIANDDRLSECFVEQMLIYALARAPRGLDDCHKDTLIERFRESQLNLRDLLKLVASSKLFTHSRIRQEGER